MSALTPKADIASPYSITSSTRARTDGGTVRPSLFKADEISNKRKHATDDVLPHFVGDACTITVIPDRTD
jgi:hypothetical protein